METYSDFDEEFWLKNPSVLIDTQYIKNIWPKQDTKIETKLNAITRMVLILTVIGITVFKTEPLRLLVTTIVTLGIIIAYHHYFCVMTKNNSKNKEQYREAFTNPELYQDTKQNYTNPTKENPFMNVSHIDIQDNPTRKPAAPIYNPVVKKEAESMIKSNITKEVKEVIEDKREDLKSRTRSNTEKKLFQDLGDEIDFEVSNRQFYTMPNTNIPNNQKEFAEFCFGNLATDKDKKFQKSINDKL